MTKAKVSLEIPPYEAPAPVEADPVEASASAPVEQEATPEPVEWLSPREKAEKEYREAQADLDALKAGIEQEKAAVKTLTRQLESDGNRLRELKLGKAPEVMVRSMATQVEELAKEIQTRKQDYENGQTFWKLQSAQIRLKYAERNLRDEQAKVWR